jgi:CRISPR-associated protein Cmr3
MTTLLLHPLDTLFFRDGRPYNQDDPGQAEAASHFPPHPPTVAGAVRAALARAMGWSGGPWDDRLKKTLGDGVDWQRGDEQLGQLRFAGPYVLKDGKPLFPAPLCVVKGKSKDGADVIDQLVPGQEVECDLNKARLPTVPKREDVEGWKTLERIWLTVEGMKRVLKGETPEPSQMHKAGEIWRSEPRIGIERHAETRTTGRFAPKDGEREKGALFAASHARLAEGVALGIEVAGVNGVDLDVRRVSGELSPLGGEGRSVFVELQEGVFKLPGAPDLGSGKTADNGVLRYMVCLITPAYLDDPWPGPGGHLSGPEGALPGHVVSACVGRTVVVGGWDSAARGPLPLQPLIPAGSVWFMEAQADEAKTVQSWHGKAIGRAAGWGFGRVLIGRWRPAGEKI